MPGRNGVLSDLTILDLSQDVAGPYCTKLLAGLGAEVIKVEPPGLGDASRKAGPFLRDDPSPETSTAFLYLNTDKKGITLDITTETGAVLLRQLAKQCDVLVESFAPGYLERLGLGYAQLESLNPGLVYTSVTPFGQTGPYRDYKGSDIVAQAVGGMMYTIGMPDKPPLKIGGDVGLYTAGISAFSGTMLAIFARDTLGYGQHVDVSAMEAMALADIHSAIRFEMRGDDGARRESNLLHAKDGWVSPGLETGVADDTWPGICKLIGKPKLATDPKFNTKQARRQNQPEMLKIIGDWVATQPKESVYHAFQALRTVSGYVATVEDLFTSKQLAERKFFQPINHSVAGKAMYPRLPFTLEGMSQTTAAAPRLGEHNTEIYCGRLGYPARDLVALRNAGVI
ncbi:MAG: CoA transferase [Dehalococcoidia bacterium]|nr:CoA transferase [Dehalococcoidia bacterium]